MERDIFKRYVEEHRDAFDNEALPPNMLGNILTKLEQNKKAEEQTKLHTKKKSTKQIYTWLAIACSLFMVLGSYLFIAEETSETKSNNSQISANKPNSAIIEQPAIFKTDEPQVSESLAERPTIHFASHRPKVDPNQDIYTGLKDSLSVASRLAAILKMNSMPSLNAKLKTELCKTFANDSNDNVRLTALEVLSKFSNDKYVQEQLMAGLIKQNDPVVQLELIKIMGNNSSPETTEKLIAMANNPFTVDAVKEQVYYALLTNDN